MIFDIYYVLYCLAFNDFHAFYGTRFSLWHAKIKFCNIKYIRFNKNMTISLCLSLLSYLITTWNTPPFLSSILLQNYTDLVYNIVIIIYILGNILCLLHQYLLYKIPKQHYCSFNQCSIYIIKFFQFRLTKSKLLVSYLYLWISSLHIAVKPRMPTRLLESNGL